MPEVVGLEDALFDPFDSNSMATAIERVLTDETFRQKLEENAPERLSAFSWERSAQLALDFLQDAAKAFPRPRDYQRRFVSNALARVKSNPRLASFPGDVAARHIARSFRRDERRQLMIDVSRLIIEDAHTGIQRVVRAILVNLMKSPPPGWVVEPVYASPNEPGYRYARSFADRILGIEHHWHEDRPVEVWSGDILCILDLEPDVLIAQREVLDAWRLQGAEVFTVVHDILPLLLPEYFPKSVGKEIIGRWVRELARHNGAICVSATVAGHLEKWMRDNDVTMNPNFRFGWFHHGSDIAASVPSRGIPDGADHIFEIMAARPTALMVGTLEPRKGHAQALDAFEILWAEGSDIALVIVGKEGWRIDELAARIRHHPEFGKRLIWLNGISDEYLNQLYIRASFLLGASEGEGFGLPLIEAARNGLPLIVRDLPVFREVAREGALFFPNDRDPAAISSAIKNWIKLRKKSSHPKPEDVRWMTWEQSAAMLADVLMGSANSVATS
jgi:glycosyltransferase involved in cell wall biosynthesis